MSLEERKSGPTEADEQRSNFGAWVGALGGVAVGEGIRVLTGSHDAVVREIAVDLGFALAGSGAGVLVANMVNDANFTECGPTTPETIAAMIATTRPLI